MKRFGTVLCIALLGMAAVHADVIFSNFGVGDSYGTSGGWGIEGPGGVFGTWMSAMGFTPTADYTLDSITVGIGYQTGTNSLDLAVYSDVGGAPGSALESWSGIAMTGPPNTIGVVETVTDTASLSLTGGTQYWVVASAGADDTSATWQWNSIGDLGPVAQDGGGGWGAHSDVRSAFRVEGTAATVPEPATCALFALGLVGLVRKRRKA